MEHPRNNQHVKLHVTWSTLRLVSITELGQTSAGRAETAGCSSSLAVYAGIDVVVVTRQRPKLTVQSLAVNRQAAGLMLALPSIAAHGLLTPVTMVVPHNSCTGRIAA